MEFPKLATHAWSSMPTMFAHMSLKTLTKDLARTLAVACCSDLPPPGNARTPERQSAIKASRQGAYFNWTLTSRKVGS